MGVHADFNANDKIVTLRISGVFDFQMHREFRDAYTRDAGERPRYTVDLRGTTYIDSSALGMLLLLREHVGGDRAKIRIINAPQEIRQILMIANFHRLFDIA